MLRGLLSFPVADRQMLHPAEERGFRPGGLVRKFDPVDPAEQLAEECHDFGFGQVSADARMNAEAVAEMTVGRSGMNSKGRSKASSSRLPEG